MGTVPSAARYGAGASKKIKSVHGTCCQGNWLGPIKASQRNQHPSERMEPAHDDALPARKLAKPFRVLTPRP